VSRDNSLDHDTDDDDDTGVEAEVDDERDSVVDDGLKAAD